MTQRFAKQTINWIELEKRVPLNQKANFFAFKAKADGYWRRIQASPPKPPEINWEEYKKIVPIPGLVDKFQQDYASLQVPFPADTMSAQVDEQWKALEPEIKAYCAEMQKQIDSAKKELARVNALPKFEDMTLEMCYDLYPKEALDPVNRPSFWPHSEEDQPGYVPPDQKAMKGSEKK